MNTGLLFFAFAAGILLGAVYFFGLWLTVKRLHDSAKPFILLFASFALRAGLVLIVVYFIMDGSLGRLAAVMAGFLISRELLKQRWGSQKAIIQ